jgi:hypothetical protein
MHLEEEYENAHHMQQKELGFRQYFENKPGSVSIKTFNIKTDKYRILAIQFFKIRIQKLTVFLLQPPKPTCWLKVAYLVQ